MFSSGPGDWREACQLESNAERLQGKTCVTPIKKDGGQLSG